MRQKSRRTVVPRTVLSREVEAALEVARLKVEESHAVMTQDLDQAQAIRRHRRRIADQASPGSQWDRFLRIFK